MVNDKAADIAAAAVFLLAYGVYFIILLKLYSQRRIQWKSRYSFLLLHVTLRLVGKLFALSALDHPLLLGSPPPLSLQEWHWASHSHPCPGTTWRNASMVSSVNFGAILGCDCLPPFHPFPLAELGTESELIILQC